MKSAILAGLGVFLLFLGLAGKLTLYVQARFEGGVIAAGAALTLVAVCHLWEARRGADHDHVDDHCDDDADCSCHDSGCCHCDGKERRFSVSYLLVLLPVALGLAVPAQALNSFAMENRAPVSVGAVPAPSRSVSMVQGGEKNILDWNLAFGANSAPAAFTGQQAHVSGFVYRKDERFDDTTFMVSRFVVTCCVADASPVGLVVRWPDAQSLPDDQWVEITGHFEPGDFQQHRVPILVAESVVPSQTPGQPYLYP